MARYNSILETIGNTPLVKLQHMAPDHVNVYVKVEAANPMGSVKDRMALAIIEDAEQSGELQPGQTVIEATSGNTGIGLAMVCAQKGYPLVVTMAENFSLERRKLLRFLGAKVVLTPAAEKGTGMLNKAIELAETHGYFLCRQFENEANANVHTRTTAAEILADFSDEPLDYFVTGFGTGGTLKGVARGLRRGSPQTKIIAAEPDNAPILGSGIAQPRDAKGNPSGSHPLFRPHLMQGWAPDFVSTLTQAAVDGDLIDAIHPVAGQTAIDMSITLARREGILVGTSSGATLAAALDIAESAHAGANIVCMLPDTGERYLSTPLFADIDTEMDADEIALSRSTAGYRFDTSAAAPAQQKAPAKTATAKAQDHVDQIIDEEPVVMFALEWCEFCWSVRRMFDRLGIAYRTVDLDSVDYQTNGLGGEIRLDLHARTGAPTIPQIYVGGSHVGGCTDVFDAYRDGDLASSLLEAGVDFADEADFDPYTLLPNWLHTRAN